MPEPKQGESRSDYLKRAIPQIMGEGKTQDQALGQAEGMYDEVEKDGYKNPDASVPPELSGPGIMNPTAAQCSNEHLVYMARRAEAAAGVYKQAKLAGFSDPRAQAESDAVVESMDANRVRELRKALRQEYARLAAIRGRK